MPEAFQQWRIERLLNSGLNCVVLNGGLTCVAWLNYLGLSHDCGKRILRWHLTMGKTVFNRKWLATYPWVRECKTDRYRAICGLCNKSLDLSKMGESALKSHMAGEKHKSNQSLAGKSTLSTMFTVNRKPACEKVAIPGIPPPAIASTSTASATTTAGASTADPMTMVDYTAGNHVLKAEVLWTLKTITDHSSYRSNDNVGQIFRTMFPDSQVASRFSCGERKTSYLCMFGIAPFFLEAMKGQIKGPYTILFDESLNKKCQTKQMDVHVRYWTEEQKVVTRYFGSQFLGKYTLSVHN